MARGLLAVHARSFEHVHTISPLGAAKRRLYTNGMTRWATYRVQLRPEFTFREARQNAAYWQSLGVSHIYCSPYLQASDGSAHGYDVVNHEQVNEELGGVEARRQFCQSLEKHQLKQLLDVVPNHMAIRGGHNAWWWDVLENGPASRYSSYFDVEWRVAGSERVLLPILGDQYGVELEAGKITLARQGGRLFVHYYEHRNPMAPRSLGHFLRPVAERLSDVDLAFVADALAELPLPNATDSASRRRRHRDKQILQSHLDQLCTRQDIADAIDLQIARTNSSPDALHDVLEAQNYRLAYWRAGNHELDYRRFFDIDSLVGLRVEDDEVFDATHSLFMQWIDDGTLDGLRIDHIDGLYDPQAYLDRLRHKAPTAWLLVEKILEGNEELPAWPVSGTTGYEFLNQVQRVLIHPEGEQPLTELSRELLGADQDYLQVVRESKLLVVREALGSDIKRLVNRLADICHIHRRYRDYSRLELDELITELCVAFPVYRTYVQKDGTISRQDAGIIRETCKQLRETHPKIDPRLIEFLEQLLLLEWKDDPEVEFVMRLQQLTGPVMAKGVEDTTFYRYVRLVALNEVGGDPSHFSDSSERFHEEMTHRQACYPEALNATATHDTKRSEDVRARLLTLSEVPDEWAAAVKEWRQRVAAGAQVAPHAGSGRERSSVVPEEPAVLDAMTEYLLWQNLVGAWPIEQSRMVDYMRKAVREAKQHSSWHSPNEPYENAVLAYLEAIYADEDLIARISSFVERLTPGTIANSLNQVLLKVTCPGVPDIYQGTETWDFSLVDPDNRRPVNYDGLRELQAQATHSSPEELWEQRSSGTVKMHVLMKGLAVRQQYPDCFGAQGTYRALSATGARADRVLAYQRGQDVVVVVTRWWLKNGDQFGDTSLELPEGRWTNVMTGASGLEGRLTLPQALGPFPSAILTREAANPSLTQR